MRRWTLPDFGEASAEQFGPEDIRLSSVKALTAEGLTVEAVAETAGKTD